MAAATTSVIFRSSTDAEFRAWGSWISGRFTAGGWTATYSAFATGTNWTDVTAPTVNNTTRVTEVWACADSAQATAPFFIKLEYGGKGTSATTPAFRISIGTGHSGGGTLTNVLYDSGATFVGGSTLNTNVMAHYASYSTGRMVFAMAVSGTSWADTDMMAFSFERRKNSSGVDQATGWLMATKMGSTVLIRAGDATSSHPGTNAFWGCALVSANEAGLSYSSNLGVGPLLYNMGPAEIGLNIVGVPKTTYPLASTPSFTILGSAHTYLVLQTTSWTTLNGAITYLFAAIRYE